MRNDAGIRLFLSASLLMLAPMAARAQAVLSDQDRRVDRDDRHEDRDEKHGDRDPAPGPGTPAPAPDSPPLISSIQAVRVASDAGTLAILWTTDKPSDSQVDFGGNVQYGRSSNLQPALVTSHVVTISGLSPGKACHYRVKSSDAQGAQAVSQDNVALLPAAPQGSDDDARAPVKFLTPARADGIDDKAVFGPSAQEVTILDVRGRLVFKASRGGGNIVWDCRDGSGRLLESGVYVARIMKSDSRVIYQSFALVK